MNSLSSQSYFLTNYTNLKVLNVSGISKLIGAVTCSTTLNVVGYVTTSGLSVFTINTTNVNTLSSYSYLNISATYNILNL